MKTLCVTVAVLSLISGSQPASLACEKLVKPVDKSPDFPGRWHLIALSSDDCLVSAIWLTFFEPSLFIDVSSTDKLNNYDVQVKVKTFGYCGNATTTYLAGNNTLQEVDSNGVMNKAVLLQTGCHDCIVIKTEDGINILKLYSRRITLTAAEMSEFQKQAECLGWKTPRILSTDHDHINCKPFEDIETEEESPELKLLVDQRLANMLKDITRCLSDKINTYLSYPRVAYEWLQQTWANLW